MRDIVISPLIDLTWLYVLAGVAVIMSALALWRGLSGWAWRALGLMEKHFATAGAVIAMLTAIVGTTVAVETRYAKSAEVKAQLEEYYAKQLKLRILEIDLKPDPTPADRALRQYLVQELNKGNGGSR